MPVVHTTSRPRSARESGPVLSIARQESRPVGALTSTWALAGASAFTLLALVGCAAPVRDDLTASRVPPVVSVNGVPLQPVVYTWYSVPDGIIRHQNPQDHPSSSADFPVAAKPSSGDLTVEIPTVERPGKIDVTYFASIDRDGQPERPLRTVRCATDPACRWDAGGATGHLTVPASPGAGFVALELAVDTPDFPSALPVRSTARYGVVLQEPQH